MAVNYHDVLSDMRAYGLEVDRLEIGLNSRGKPWRVRVREGGRERRGWYVVHELRADDGEIYLIGSYGVYHGTDPGTQKISLARGAKISPEARASARQAMAADRARVKAQREGEARRAAARAARVWALARSNPPDGGAEYLARKGVQPHGLRYTDSGAVLVPMCDARGNVHGLQFILPAAHPARARLGRDKTYWPAGLAVSGHFHLIGNPSGPRLCLVAEGYATAATLHAATGIPVAVAFDAGNMQPVATAISKAYRGVRVLCCADDDYLTDGNPGITAASNAALAVGGAWLAPVFPSDRGGAKLTDFNDLQHFPTGGIHVVGAQVRAKLEALGWQMAGAFAGAPEAGGGDVCKPLLTLDEAAARYSLVYGGGGTLYDHWAHCLVPKQDVLDVLPDHGWRDWKQRPDRRVVRIEHVGFDPGETDPAITCNLWAGWPTAPAAGNCEALLDLLRFLCSDEPNAAEVYQWVLRWLAYPLQHPGAKMRTSLVFHGAQGAGKNLLFESIMRIYGPYGGVIDQAAVESQFNDWASRKLFLVCDEVVARQELFHLKNKLKALITGERIRINPKHVAPHDETNHCNLVFLSNELQPLVLEQDDRRYLVVWIPGTLPAGVYDAIGEEVADGGIPALHDFLLRLDLGDFKPWSAPPVTRAKRELINVSLESSDRFVDEWLAGEAGYPAGPAGSMDLYAAYRRWANANGVIRPRESNRFLGGLAKRRGWAVRAVHVYESTSAVSGTRSQKMVIPPADVLEPLGVARAPDERMVDWASRHFFRFREALDADRF